MKSKNVFVSLGIAISLMLTTTFDACKKEEENNNQNPARGAVLWSYGDFHKVPEETGNVGITAPAIGPDGTIYVASADGNSVSAKVHAINSNGKLKWTTDKLDYVNCTDPAVGTDGTIYIIGYYTVYAINPTDGSFKWTYEVSADEHYRIHWLALGNNGEVFFSHIATGSYDWKVFALNKDGQELWKANIGGIASHLTIGIDGTLFAHCSSGNDHFIKAVDPGDGSIIWSKTLDGYLIATSGIAISPDGELVVSQASPDKLLKIDISNGESTWEIDAVAGMPSIAPDGSIYILGNGYYCYNSSGELKWTIGINSIGGEVAIDIDGNTYVAGQNFGEGNFQVYRPDGTLHWAVFQNMSYNRCLAIGSNNVIYVSYVIVSPGSSILYALKGDKPLASAGWPRDTGGNRSTRNASLH